MPHSKIINGSTLVGLVTPFTPLIGMHVKQQALLPLKLVDIRTDFQVPTSAHSG